MEPRTPQKVTCIGRAPSFGPRHRGFQDWKEYKESALPVSSFSALSCGPRTAEEPASEMTKENFPQWRAMAGHGGLSRFAWFPRSAKTGLKNSNRPQATSRKLKAKKGRICLQVPLPLGGIGISSFDKLRTGSAGLPAAEAASRPQIGSSCAPRNLSAITVASLMRQRVTAFPLHLVTGWSLWTDLFSTQGAVAKWLAAQQLNVAGRSSVADFATHLGTVWTVWTLWTVWTVFLNPVRRTFNYPQIR